MSSSIDRVAIMKMRERLKSGCDKCKGKIHAVYSQKGSVILCYKCYEEENNAIHKHSSRVKSYS